MICVAAVNTCPKRKLVIAETQVATAQGIDSGLEGAPSICSEGISQKGFHETFKAGDSAAPASAAMFRLNLLNNAPGATYYSPPGLLSSFHADLFPLFLKNRVLII